MRLTIGERVATLRKRRGFTQADLLALVDISPNMLTRIETGDCDPRASDIDKIAVALGFAGAADFLAADDLPADLTIKADESRTD